MKNIAEYINEGIFGDNVKSAMVYHGETVDPKIWKECKKSFEWFRKDILKDQNTLLVDVGLIEKKPKKLKFNIIYNEDDCVIMEGFDGLAFICPETIWFNYVKGSLKNIQTSGDTMINNPRITFYCMTFAKKQNGDYYGIEYCLPHEPGYLPSTISDKAKKIIEKY